MISVDIHVPVLDRAYDFELNEELETGRLIEDILILIAREEHLHESEGGNMYFYAVRQEIVLRREETLGNQGVRNGDRLVLI